MTGTSSHERGDDRRENAAADDAAMTYVERRLAALAQGATTDGVALRVRTLWDCLRHTPNVLPGEEPGEVTLTWTRSGWHVEIDVSGEDVHPWAVPYVAGAASAGATS